jgi:hypothetical protein
MGSRPDYSQSVLDLANLAADLATKNRFHTDRREPDVTASEYAEKVVLDFMRNITDHVFLNIQSNEGLMREYQTQVNENSLMEVNTAIGRKVKELFKLENDGVCDKPKSWLIKDFTYHRK